MARVTWRSDPDLERDLARELLRARRDARYRTNIEFAIKQLWAVIVIAVVVGSLLFGWPVPHAALEHLPLLHSG